MGVPAPQLLCELLKAQAQTLFLCLRWQEPHRHMASVPQVHRSLQPEKRGRPQEHRVSDQECLSEPTNQLVKTFFFTLNLWANRDSWSSEHISWTPSLMYQHLHHIHFPAWQDFKQCLTQKSSPDTLSLKEHPVTPLRTLLSVTWPLSRLVAIHRGMYHEFKTCCDSFFMCLFQMVCWLNELQRMGKPVYIRKGSNRNGKMLGGRYFKPQIVLNTVLGSQH